MSGPDPTAGGNPLFVRLCLALVRVFYPHVAVSHADRVPAEGPCIVVANHPNGLLDPLLVRLATGKPTRFLAKSTLWENPVGRATMEAFGAMPVYRPQEADTSRNEVTFERCRALLGGGGWLALFPEGKSHDETELQPLKTGAARIAIGAAAQAGRPVRILPVGLNYEDKAIFRSGVGVVVGEALVVQPTDADPAALTRRVGESLGAVVLQARDEELWRGIVAVATWTAADGGRDRAARDQRALALADRVKRAASEAPERVDEAVAATRRFVRLMRTLGVSDPFLVQPDLQPGAAAASVFPLLALLPAAIVGTILGWIPYRAVKPLALRLSHGSVEAVGTLKLLGGMLFLPLGWAAWAVAAGLVAGPLAAVAVGVAGPLTGLAALRFDERLTRRREALLGWLRATDPRVTKAVEAHRAELCRLVEAALPPG